jgi:phosphoserine phosphatase
VRQAGEDGSMRWRPYEHIFFDCDSTLTTIEGIDILAESAGKRWRVEVLTQAAMDGDLDLSEVYERRLRAVRPTRRQIREVHRAYKRNPVEDAQAVIAALQHLGAKVYIISGGLLEPVREFGLFLGVPKDHIRAVGVTYNELSGQWWVGGDQQYLTYDDGALTVSDGKAEIVRELLAGQHGRSLLIGDGTSDLLAGSAVDLFVGYGGVVSRQRVLEGAPLFIHSQSLAPLLAVAAGPAALRQLRDTSFEALGQKSWDLIQAGALGFNDERLARKFREAVAAAHQAVYSRPGGSSPGDPGRPGAVDDWTSDAGVR